jgi:hypothetical protein
MARERLSRQQVDALLARLRTLGIRPGLPVTILWQFGWAVPPLELLPVVVYFIFSIVLFTIYIAVFTLVIMDVGIDSSLWFGTLAGAVLFSFAFRRLVVRSRAHAVFAFICLIAIPVVFMGWLLAQPMAAAGTISLQTYSSLLDSSFVRNVLIALLIGLAFRHYRFRRKLGGLRWRQMVAEVTVAEVF